jgi:hypothetical protein
MLLQDLQTYLKQQHGVSLQDLERRFHIGADRLREVLNQLIRKGRIQKQKAVNVLTAVSVYPRRSNFTNR